jgi:hypothetical protein
MASRDFVIIYVARSGWNAIRSATKRHEMYNDTIRAGIEKTYPRVVFDSIGILVRKTDSCPPLSGVTNPANSTYIQIPTDTQNITQHETAINTLYDMLHSGHVIDTDASQGKYTIVLGKPSTPTTITDTEILRILERLVTVFKNGAFQ